MYSEFEPTKKELTISTYGKGVEDIPLYLADVEVYESISHIAFGDAYLVVEEEPQSTLPEGQCDIICKKSPWSK